jgi:WD40 repeat protein
MVMNIRNVMSLGVLLIMSYMMYAMQSQVGESSAMGNARRIVPSLFELSAEKIAQLLHDNLTNLNEIAGSGDFNSKKKNIKDHFQKIGVKNKIAEVYRRLYPEEFPVITSIIFSPDGSLIACAASHTIQIWARDKDNNITLSYILNNHETVKSIAFSHDGTLLATGSHEGVLRIWGRKDNNSFSILQTLPISPSQLRLAKDSLPIIINSIAFGPNGNELVLGLNHFKVLICTKQNNRFRLIRSLKIEEAPSHAAYSSDMFVALSADGEVLIVGVGGDKKGPLKMFRKHQAEWTSFSLMRKQVDELPMGIKSVAFAPSKYYFAFVADYGDVFLYFRSVYNLMLIRKIRGDLVALSATGVLATYRDSKIIDIWKSSDMDLSRLHMLELENKQCISIALSSAGDYLAAATSNGDSRFEIWKINQGIVRVTDSVNEIWEHILRKIFPQPDELGVDASIPHKSPDNAAKIPHQGCEQTSGDGLCVIL